MWLRSVFSNLERFLNHQSVCINNKVTLPWKIGTTILYPFLKVHLEGLGSLGLLSFHFKVTAEEKDMLLFYCCSCCCCYCFCWCCGCGSCCCSCCLCCSCCSCCPCCPCPCPPSSSCYFCVDINHRSLDPLMESRQPSSLCTTVPCLVCRRLWSLGELSRSSPTVALCFSPLQTYFSFPTEVSMTMYDHPQGDYIKQTKINKKNQQKDKHIQKTNLWESWCFWDRFTCYSSHSVHLKLITLRIGGFTMPCAPAPAQVEGTLGKTSSLASRSRKKALDSTNITYVCTVDLCR